MWRIEKQKAHAMTASLAPSLGRRRVVIAMHRRATRLAEPRAYWQTRRPRSSNPAQRRGSNSNLVFRYSGIQVSNTIVA